MCLEGSQGSKFRAGPEKGLRVGPWVGPGSEWSQVTGWGLEWEGHIGEEAQGQSPGALTVGVADLS